MVQTLLHEDIERSVFMSRTFTLQTLYSTSSPLGVPRFTRISDASQPDVVQTARCRPLWCLEPRARIVAGKLPISSGGPEFSAAPGPKGGPAGGFVSWTAPRRPRTFRCHVPVSPINEETIEGSMSIDVRSLVDVLVQVFLTTYS